MRFSIIIPTWNNLKYLKLCIDSINKNSTYQHDLNIHLNEATDGSLNFVKNLGIKYSYSEKNIGLCSAVNKASELANTDFILYSHDDMYFLPDWDVFLEEEINKMNTNMYYLSGTTIGPLGCGLNGNKSVNQLNQDEIKNFDFNCGKNIDEFDEDKLLTNYKNVKYYDHQGSHWAPHLIHKSIWNRVGGFSKEFDPGYCSDTDLNMKLWNLGVRIFKGINHFRVYHFGSITTRKKKELVRNKGNKLFLIKWGVSSDLFVNFYLNSNKPYYGKLKDKPILSLKYFIKLFTCKIKLFFLKIVNRSQ